jgi:ABC-2 type transport system permease protein
MDKLLAIIKREYTTRVKSKGFIFGTIITPLFMAALVFMPMLFMGKSGQTSHRLVVLDQTQTETIYQRAREQLTREKESLFEVRRETITADRLEARQQELNADIKAERLDGYVVLPPDVLQSGKIFRRTKNVNDFTTNRTIRDAFNAAIIWQRLTNAGINAQAIEALSKNIEVEFINDRGEKESPLGQWALSFLLGIILYVTILVYGIYVLQGVIEEKQSRIVEVLLSSVKPFQLLLGKVLGIGLVSLTQITVWAVSFGIVSALAAAQAIAFGSFKIPRIPVSTLLFFGVYFVLGYFLYATLYALVGAMVSNQEDGQQAQFPITMSIAISMAFSSFIMTKPDSTASVIVSLIPFFSPILMFMRITVQQPPWWQIALSIALLIGAIFGAVWLAAKIYRVGVLMYGKRPSLPELMKWLKYT